jgi:nitrous oxidase accessory protein NosD
MEDGFVLRHSAWQKRPVRTFIVNSRSRIATERSITGAIARCQPFDRIEVVGGEYYESVSFPFPLELVASEGERPVVTFRGAAFQCAANASGYVCGMTFVSKSKIRQDFSVVVSSGTLLFVDCTIASVMVTGNGNPTFSDCEISGSSNGIGVRFAEGGSGTFTQCRIHSHQEVCVALHGHGTPLVRECVIYQVTDTMAISCEGLLADEATSGAIFEKNTIYCEQLPAPVQLVSAAGRSSDIRGMASMAGDTSCVYVAFGAAPTFRSNELPKGAIGFIFESGGIPRLESNMIRCQRVCGIRVSLGSAEDDQKLKLSEAEKHRFSYRHRTSQILLDGSNVFDRCHIGVDVVGAHKSPIIDAAETAVAALRAEMLNGDETTLHNGQDEQNSATVHQFIKHSRQVGVSISKARFTHCADCAVRYSRRSFGHIEECEIESTGGHGVVIVDGAFPTVARCRFKSNGQSAVYVTRGANPVIVANQFRQHRQGSIVFTDSARGVVIENIFERNEGVCVTVVNSSAPLIKRNVIINNTGGGALAMANAKPVLEKNHFSHNGPFEFRAETHAQPTLRANEFAHPDTVAIHYTTCASGEARDNTIAASRGHGIIIELDADPLIVGNRVRGCGVDGIHVRNNGLGTVIRNVVADCQRYNVHLVEGGDATVRDNDIIGGLQGGVGISDEGCGVVEKNNFRDNNNAHIVVSGKHTSPLIQSNICSNGTSNGILCRDGASGIFRRNRCFNNTVAGIHCQTGAAPTFENNAISNERIGILCDTDSAAIIRNNRITACSTAGLVVQAGAKPKAVQNLFTDNLFAGVLLTNGCSGMVLRNTFTGNAVGVASRSTTSVIATTSATRYDPAKSTVVEDNDIFGNLVAGVILESGASGRFVQNRIHHNRRWGVLGHVDYFELVKTLNVTAAVVEPKLFEPERHTNVSARVGGGTAVFTGNDVHDHEFANISFVNHPVQNEFVFENNTIHSAIVGLSTESASVVNLVKNNTISECGTGVFLGGSARARFEGNTITRCDFANVHLAMDCQPVFANNNIISASKTFGVFVEGYARGYFADCSITKNALAGAAIVHALRGHRPTTRFTKCSFEDNLQFGVVFVPSSRPPDACPYPLFTRHSSSRLGGFDYEVDDDNRAPNERESVTFEHNAISQNRMAGVFVGAKFAKVEAPQKYANPAATQAVGVDFRGQPASPTTTSGNHNATVRTKDSNCYFPPLFTGNQFEKNAVGIVVDANSEPDFRNNIIAGNRTFGAVSRPFAAPVFDGNRIHHNSAVGLYFAQQAKGRATKNEIRDNNPTASHSADSESDSTMRLSRAWDVQDSGSKWSTTNDLSTIYSKIVAKFVVVTSFYASPAALRLCVSRPKQEIELLSPTSLEADDLSAALTAIVAPEVKFSARGIGVWLEQGGEAVIEDNEIAMHATAGLLYSPLALLDSSAPALDEAHLDSSLSTSMHDLAQSSSQTLSAGGGSVVRRNRISNNVQDGIRVLSVVRPTPLTDLTAPIKCTTRQADAKKRQGKQTSIIGRRSSGITISEPPPPVFSGTQKPRSPAAEGVNDFSSVIVDAAPPLETAMNLAACHRPPSQAVLIEIVGNIISRNGGSGIFIEQLYALRSSNDATATGFEAVAPHRLVLPPRVDNNTFASNEGPAVRVALSPNIEGAVAVLLQTSGDERLASKSSPAASARSTPSFDQQHHLSAAADLWYYAPQLSGNTFEGGHTGVLVESGANAVLRNNSFKRLELGVHTRGTTSTLIAAGGNTFGTSTVGIRLEHSLNSKVMRCTFDLHTNAALYVLQGATPVVAKCWFRAPPGSNTASPSRDDSHSDTRAAPESVALAVLDNTTSPKVLSNRFEGLRLAMYVADFAAPVAHRNHFRNCNVGLHVDRGGEGVYATNYFNAATDSGALVTHSSSYPVFHESVFEQCARAGLRAALGAGGRVKRCYFTANHVGLLTDDAGSHFKAEDSVFRGNKHVAVLVRSGKMVDDVPVATSSNQQATPPQRAAETVRDEGPQVSGCFFEDNRDADVTIRENGSAQIVGNLMLGACVSSSGGRGIFEANRLLGRVERALVAELGGRSVFRGNVVNHAKIAMCALPHALALFEDNFVYNCAIGIDGEKGSRSIFVRNTLAFLTDCAATVAGSSVQDCDIAEAPSGIVCSDGTPSVTGNTIRKCAGEGILVTGGGSVEKNIVMNCRVGLRIMSTVATPSVDANFFMDCTGEGILLAEACRGTLTNNDCFDHGTASLAVQRDAMCTIEGNRISSPNDRSAMDLHPENKCIMKANTIRNQFSPAYKKALASARAKDMTKYLATLQARINAGDATTVEVSGGMRSLVDLASRNRDSLVGEPFSPPGREALFPDESLHAPGGGGPAGMSRSLTSPSQQGAHFRRTGFAGTDSDHDGGATSSANRTPSTPSTPRGGGDPTLRVRRRAASLVDGLDSPVQARAGSAAVPAPRARSQSSASKLVDAVSRVRTATVSATAAKAKAAKSATNAATRVTRVLIHRFTSCRGPAAALTRDLGGQVQSASDNVEGFTSISTTTRDPVSSVLRTSTCDGLVICLPPASETLTDEELGQLNAVAQFVKARNLAALALKSALTSGGGDEDATPASAAANAKAKSKGIVCVCVIPKFYLSSDGALFKQGAVTQFLRAYGCLVDDGSTSFLTDLMHAMRTPTSAEGGVKDLVAKYGVPEGFVPSAVQQQQHSATKKPVLKDEKDAASD